jgi:hypothetical protein
VPAVRQKLHLSLCSDFRDQLYCRSDELTGTSVDWAALPQLPYGEFVLKHLFEGEWQLLG